LKRLAETFDGVASDPGVCAVVITGQGRSFCSGLDLKIVPSLGDADQKRLLNALNRAFTSRPAGNLTSPRSQAMRWATVASLR
jgi:enoyl-CoA hydratase/carnithine racemase